ncbi:MAG TPA: glycosyltransferase family 4 protein [Rhodanobacteraceae bacterium]
MNLALVISSLEGGGAERVMSVLANAWADAGDVVTLITLAPAHEDKYVLGSTIRRIELGVTVRSNNVPQALLHNLTRVRAVRRALRRCRPDVAISFVTRTNVLTLLASIGLRIPVVVSERTFVPSERWMNGFWGRLYRPLYGRAEAVVVQTQRSADAMERALGRAVTIIPNPLSDAPANATGDASSLNLAAAPCHRRRVLLAAGRLSPEKGFEDLIDAFARIAKRYPRWDLKIVGEGMLRGVLGARIARHGLESRVSVPGFDPDVRATMRRSDLFVLSSRFEGFPNVLLEAMAEGMACVSFDCEAGPRELIKHGENGWLVPPRNVAALSGALATAMDDDALRARIGARARNVRSLYSPQRVLGQWNALLRSLAPVVIGERPLGGDAQ